MSLACLACSGLLLPTASLRAQSPEAVAAHRILDVALQHGNFLQGRVVDTTGQPVPEVSVVLLREQKLTAQVLTDREGEFHIGPLAGGAYLLQSSGQAVHVRAWTHRTAPPSAAAHALLIVGNVERGQDCTTGSCTTPGVGGGLLSVLTNPFVIGAAIAAAIAIPLALDDDDAS